MNGLLKANLVTNPQWSVHIVEIVDYRSISRARGRFARSDLASICKINVAISKFSRSRKAFMKRYRSEVTGTWTGAFYADLARCKTVSFTSYTISGMEQLETKLETMRTLTYTYITYTYKADKNFKIH